MTANDYNSLMDIRVFLHRSGLVIPPWRSAREVIDALYILLDQKKNDDEFWTRIKELVLRLEIHQFNLSPLRDSLGLNDTSVDTLISDLRRGLATTHLPCWKQFYARAGVTGFLSFLVLGTALGCREDCSREVEDLGIQGDDAEVYCELVGIINEADVAWSCRVNLLDCLPEIDAATREQWLQRFQWLSDRSDAELAGWLEELSSTWPCDSDDDPWWKYDEGSTH